MPHFIIDCSTNIVNRVTEDVLLNLVHETAKASGLFIRGDIKVRVNAYSHFLVDGTKADFIHVFGHVLEGRTTEQKAALSKSIVKVLMELLPDVPFIAMNISEFEKATYCNRDMITLV
jgi:5-carboxymethyl-2-hydroxymuconate isomerase